VPVFARAGVEKPSPARKNAVFLCPRRHENLFVMKIALIANRPSAGGRGRALFLRGLERLLIAISITAVAPSDPSHPRDVPS
jgi:hypothetical protein